MAFDSLSDKLQNIFKNLRGKGRLSEADVKAALKEVKMALLEADVNFKVVKQFIKSVEERAIGQDVMTSLTPGQMVIKIVNEEMVSLMGSTTTEIPLKSGNEITVIMMVGLQGAGKTTTAAKLAGKFKSKGKKPLLTACDIYRPAAVEQLKVWANRTNSLFYGKENTDPAGVIYDGLELAKKEAADIVLIDTAGRLQNKVNLMKELEKMNKVIAKIIPNAPHETLLVIDATTGQNGIMQAKSFKEITNITGIVLTKLDGTAKGGIVLAIKEDVKIPVKFIGLGEGINDLKPFDIESYIYGLFKDMM